MSPDVRVDPMASMGGVALGCRWLRTRRTAAAIAATRLGEWERSPTGASAPSPPPTIRVATFNASLHRRARGELLAALEGGGDAAALATAAIVRTVEPDIILINELDADPDGATADALAHLFAADGGPGTSTRYPHRFTPPVNTGRDSGFDLDRDGARGGPGDAMGYGAFEGQFGWTIFSRYPVRTDLTRCYGSLRWRDLPGATLPDDPATDAPADWYDPAALEVLPLSSKNHCDVVIEIEGSAIHVLASHPTPPVFDGPEDRNGHRNHDEIRFWRLYVDGAALTDDAGVSAGLPGQAPFVIVGDLNADPNDGDASGSPVKEHLLSHARVLGVAPRSRGAQQATRTQRGANDRHIGPAATDTSDFPDDDPGNLRVDYVLPSSDFEVMGSGVFWPLPDDPQAAWIEHSDHRLVWVDVRLARPPS